LFLSIGKGWEGHYAALRYLWGKVNVLPLHATTSSNIGTRRWQINDMILPETFSDVIFACRHSGIRFLWIDSVCTIQNSAEDWKTQSAQMGDIYSKTILTISAAHDTDSNSNLFSERSSWKTKPCQLDFSTKATMGKYIKGRPITVYQNDKTYEDGNLDRRDWACQEKYLSSQMLRFSSARMHWICSTRSASESRPTGFPPDKKFEFGRFMKDNKSSTPWQQGNFCYYMCWCGILEQYSKCLFTYESDRIIALSGLASRCQLLLGDEYITGLWKEDLVRSLLFVQLSANMTVFLKKTILRQLAFLLGPGHPRQDEE
jgi:hypothetical protein